MHKDSRLAVDQRLNVGSRRAHAFSWSTIDGLGLADLVGWADEGSPTFWIRAESRFREIKLRRLPHRPVVCVLTERAASRVLGGLGQPNLRLPAFHTAEAVIVH